MFFLKYLANSEQKETFKAIFYDDEKPYKCAHWHHFFPKVRKMNKKVKN